jgi:DNA-binding NarL/FixJ family response regulator
MKGGSVEEPNGTLGEVLVADPDPAGRSFTTGLLREAGYQTVPVASGRQALNAARGEQLRLAVLEVELPDICGYEVCRRLRAEQGDALPIVFLSGTRTESFDRVGGILLGADDYLCKPLVADEFLARVGRLMQRPGAVKNRPALTGREREVLGLLSSGMRQKEIAEQLRISPKTVGTHLEHIFSKLGAKHRLQAVVLARRQGLAV